MSRHVRISIRTARDRYPAVVSLLSGLRSAYDEVVVEEGGVLPKAVARSAARTSGKVMIGFRIVNDGTLIEVPEGRKVREIARPLDPSHVIQIETTDAARRLTHSGGRRVVRAATVVIYHTATAS